MRSTGALLLWLAAVPAARAQVPVLRPLPSVQLADFADAPMTRPRAFAVDQAGDLYVLDIAQAAVLRFDARGVPVRRYGTRGDGPGELQAPASITLVGDTALAVSDARRRDVSLFDRTTGRFLTRYSIPGSPGGVRAHRRELWIGALNLGERTTVARISVRDGSTETGVAPPILYTPGSPVTLANSFVYAVAAGETMVVAFAATDYLLAIQSSGSQDTLHLPPTKRRGIPRDLTERFTRISGPGDYYEMVSTVVGADALDREHVLVAHADMNMRPNATFEPGPSAPDPFTYRMHVSIARLRDQRVCTDIAVPVSGEVLPAVAMRGDTLYVVDVNAHSDTAPWLVRRFQVQPSACAWQPARRAG